MPRDPDGGPRPVEGDHIPSDPDATFQLRFIGGVEAWSVPAGNWEFEVFGSEGVIRSENNGAGITLRTAAGPGRRPDVVPAPIEVPEARSPVVACLEDLVDAYESGRPTRSPVDLSARIVDACVAVADSHRRRRLGGAAAG